MNNLFDEGLIPIEQAAKELGMDVKRLRGYVYRDSAHYGDPIGSLETDQVYGWSLKYIADTSTAAAIPGATLSDEAGEVVK